MASEPATNTGSGIRNTFGKEEKLRSQKLIDDIFQKKGTGSLLRFPLLAVWKFTSLPEPSPAQVLFSISTRNFKKAHDRNRIRRQLREIYRLRKNNFYDFLIKKQMQCALVLIYVAKEKLPYNNLETAISDLLKHITKGENE